MLNSGEVALDAKKEPKKILVVEDNVALRFTLAEWLRSKGLVVHEAATADEAVLVLKSLLHIDAVITDVDMPGVLNGLGLAEHVRREAPGLPVIVVSGHHTAEHIDAPNVKFFRKPYDLNSVYAYVTQMLEPDQRPQDE